MNDKELQERTGILEEALNPEKSTSYKPKIWAVGALSKHPFPPQVWVIDRLIAEETITVLSGAPTSNKTWLTLEMAKAVATGQPFLGHFETTQGGVLIVNEEDNIRYLKERCELLGITDLPIKLISQSNFRVDDPTCRNFVLNQLNAEPYKLLIFDSLRRINALDENDSRNSKLIFEQLQEFTKAGVSVIVTHHHRKEGRTAIDLSQSMRGSSDILAAVDGHIAVALDPRHIEQISAHQTKIKVAEALPPFTINKVKLSPGLRFEYGGEIEAKLIQREKAKQIVTDVLKIIPEATREQLTEEINKVERIGNTNISKALTEMEEYRDILSRKDGKTKIYSLPPVPEPVEL